MFYKSCIPEKLFFSFPSSVPVSLCQAIYFSAFSVCQTINLFWSKFHIHHNENKGKGHPQTSEISPSIVKAGQCFCILNESFITVKIIIYLNGWMMPYSSLVGTTGNIWTFQVLGSIPWQTYFQRVLSAASPGQARLISYLSGLGCFSMAIPSVLIGAVAASTGKTNSLWMWFWIMNVVLSNVIKTRSKEVLI